MNSRIDLQDLLECAVSAARTAGDHALQNTSRRDEIEKTFDHDVKLKLDIECQAKAEEIIHGRYPDHDILGEETVKEDVSKSMERHSPYEWIIDPIDGTVNFSHGLQYWCCSVAIRHQNDIVAGAVYAPALNELYTATVESPALCNDTSIKVSTIDTLSSAIVMTGMDKCLSPNVRPFTMFEKIASNAQKARIIGSAALDICLVACGHADGYLETGIYIWDIAAAWLILKQAGGKAEIIEYRNDNRLSFLATNSRIHEELKKLADKR